MCNLSDQKGFTGDRNTHFGRANKTGKQMKLQTGKKIDKQVDKQIDKQIDGKMNKQTIEIHFLTATVVVAQT